MARYEVTRTLDLYEGIVGLNKHQAAARAQCLEQLPDGTYNIIAPVQFKAGEVIVLVKPDKATRTRLAAKKSAGKNAPKTKAPETEAPETEAPVVDGDAA